MDALANSVTYVPTPEDVDFGAHVVIRGTANLARDPLYRDGGDRIYKRLPLSDLPLTVGRWLDMGREITSVHTYHAPPREWVA